MFSQFGLILLAVLPGLIISYLIYSQDKYDKEPKLVLLVCFVLGMLITYPAIKIEGWLQTFSSSDMGKIGPLLFVSFIVVALVEELVKFVCLYLYPYRNKAFNEPLDGIVYAVMIGMGFATLENILYAYRFGAGTVLFRAFTAVPAHGVFAIIMGYYTGLFKFDPQRNKLLIIKSLAFPVLLHGIYDLFILQEFHEWIMTLATFTLAIGMYFSVVLFRKHAKDSFTRSQQIKVQEFKITEPLHTNEEDNEILDAVIDDLKSEEE